MKISQILVSPKPSARFCCRIRAGSGRIRAAVVTLPSCARANRVGPLRKKRRVFHRIPQDPDRIPQDLDGSMLHDLHLCRLLKTLIGWYIHAFLLIESANGYPSIESADGYPEGYKFHRSTTGQSFTNASL